MTKNKCEDCDLAYRCDSNKLKGSGSKTSDIMLVFDNPSKADDQEGEIGIGDSGMKLNYYLQRAGLKKSDVYITSAIKCNTYKAADLKAAHAEACQKHLIAEILKIRPKLVVPMGRWAWQSLSGETSIGEFRGHFDEVELDYTYNGKPKTFKCNLLPTFSPSSCLTKWEWDDYVIHDLKKAKRFVKKGKKGLTPTPKWETILDTHGLDKFVDHYSKVDFCITDFETTGLDFWRHEIINAGYCAEKDFVTIVPFIKYPKEHTLKFDEENLARAAQINKFVGKHKSKIVKAMREVHRQCGGFGGHNLKFDAKFARYNKIPYRKVLHDSVIKDSVIDENKKHDLNSCMEYRGINYGAYDTTIWQWVGKTKKNKKPYTYIPPYEIEKYLAIDCAGAFRLDKKQNIELKEQKLYNFYFKRQMALTREMTRIEYKGHKMDRALMESDKKKVKALFEKNKKKILKIVGDEDFNPNSVDQVSKYMEENNYPFERLEIKEGKKGYSTNADSLMKFCRFKKWRTFPELILMNRSLTKNLGTYIENKDGTAGMMRFLDQNDFIHSNFNIHTPRTGRLCVAKGSMVEVVRNLSKHPSGIAIENVKKGDMVYSYDSNRKLVLRKVLWSGKTGHKKIVRVHWQGTGHKHKGYLDVTPEHKIRLISGEYREAGELKKGDRILSLSRSKTSGYSRLHPFGNKELRDHRFIHEQITKRVAQHVHHKDGDKLNNEISNLEGLTSSEHTSQHAREVMSDPKNRLRVSMAMKKLHKEEPERWAHTYKSGEANKGYN